MSGRRMLELCEHGMSMSHGYPIQREVDGRRLWVWETCSGPKLVVMEEHRLGDVRVWVEVAPEEVTP